MVLVRQNACDSCDIMIIHKCHEMLSAVNTPLFRSELTVQGMCDLEQIHAVETGINSLIAFIIRATVKHLIIDDQIVVTKEDFSDQCKPWFDRFTEAAEAFHKIMIQTIGNIQTESVDAEVFDPKLYTVQQIIYNSRILKIQLDQFKMTFPAFIPETIIITTVSVETDMKPVFIRRVPFLFLDIPECPEAASDMVEDTVKDYFDIL